MNGSASNGALQHSYTGASSQPYAVRSPAQSYAAYSAPPSAVTQSPHSSIKSPLSATHSSATSMSMNGADPTAQMHSAHMPYRSSSYALSSTPQSAHSGHDMNGLGISSNGHYTTQAPNGQGYHHYASSAQAFRPVTELASTHAAAQYAQ